MRYICID